MAEPSLTYGTPYATLSERIAAIAAPKPTVAPQPTAPMQSGEFKAAVQKYIQAGYPEAQARTRVTQLYANRSGITQAAATQAPSTIKPVAKAPAATAAPVPGDTSLIFRGDYGIIRIAEDPSNLYWVDIKNGTMQRFESPAAVTAFGPLKGYTVDMLDSQGIIQTVPMASLAANNLILRGDNEGLIDNTGKNPLAVEQSSTPAYTATYGQAPVSQEDFDKGWKGFVGILKLAKDSGISQATIDAAAKDPGFYVNALLYGGYGIPDIWQDLKRRDLIAAGNTSLSGVTVIDGNTIKSVFQNTSAGKSATANSLLALPVTMAGIDTETFDLPIYDLPDDAYKALTTIDPTSPEFQAEMDNVQSLYFDNLDQQLAAKTKGEHDIARGNWDQLRDYVDKTYNITLSANAYDAWDQIKNLGTTYSAAGLAGSGLQQEVEDRYLNRLRMSNELARTQHLNAEDTAKMQYYTQSASPQEIAGLSQEDKQKYGLVPSPEEAEFYTLENLKTKYPGETDEHYQDIINSVIDPDTGLHRSAVYKTLATNQLATKQAETQYKQQMVQEKWSQTEEKAAAAYTKPETFSKPADTKTTWAVGVPGVAPKEPITQPAPTTPATPSSQFPNLVVPKAITPTPAPKAISSTPTPGSQTTVDSAGKVVVGKAPVASVAPAVKTTLAGLTPAKKKTTIQRILKATSW